MSPVFSIDTNEYRLTSVAKDKTNCFPAVPAFYGEVESKERLVSSFVAVKKRVTYSTTHCPDRNCKCRFELVVAILREWLGRIIETRFPSNI
jgi:hypothetical protein